MSTNYTDLFIDDCKALVCSIRVKFASAAHAINRGLIQRYGASIVDPSTPSSWKYYQNICGEYHSTDTPMMVNSLDNKGVQIAFTKESLARNPLTKDAYAFGSIYYRTLLQAYPSQEDLMLGILYPADMQKAIDSQDGTILSYPGFLIKDYEYTFTQKLQKWLLTYFFRWVNPSYSLYHNLYVASVYEKLTLHMLGQILLIRMQATKTSEAHEYFVRAYLQGCQGIDKYMKYMTRAQQLFFYRNYDYIRKHAGSQSVFETLSKALFFDRGMRLYSYDMKHVVTQMLAEGSSYPVSTTPEVKFTRKQLLGADLSIRDDSLFSLENINILLNDQARANETELALAHSSEIEKLKFSPSSRVKTKLLHCVSEDYSHVSPRQFIALALNHWLSYSMQDHYTATGKVDLFFNNQVRYLSAKQAGLLYIYCLNAAAGNTLTTIPTFYTRGVVKIDLPSEQDILAKMFPGKYTLGKIAAIRNKFAPVQTPIVGIEAFYDTLNTIYHAVEYAQRASGYEQDIYSAACAKMAHAWMYEHRKCAVNANVESLLSDLNLDFTGLSKSNHFEIAQLLCLKFTGLADFRGITLKDVQAAMIEMFKLMSSYSIALTSELWSDDAICTNPTAMRFTGYGMIRAQDLFIRPDNLLPVVTLTHTNHRAVVTLSKDYSIAVTQNRTGKTASVNTSLSSFDLDAMNYKEAIAVSTSPVRTVSQSEVTYVPTQEQLAYLASKSK